MRWERKLVSRAELGSPFTRQVAGRINAMEVRSQQEHSSDDVAGFVGRIFLIPFRTLLYGMEMLVHAMRRFQSTGDSGLQAIAVTSTVNPVPRANTPALAAAAPGNGGLAESVTDNNHTFSWERRSMDKNLNDDMLKLVRYKVLFVKRGYEHAFPEREALVWDNMDPTAFTAWKIAEFIQMLGRRDTDVPPGWGNYPSGEQGNGPLRDKDVLLGFPEEDKKFLRVFYQVLERYPREKLRYEEQHLDVLKEIKHEIGKLRPRP